MLAYRWKDAAVAGVGMRYKQFIGMMSYDFNTSYLRSYTSGRGGFELSLTYQGAFVIRQSAPTQTAFDVRRLE